jgi:CRISPR-associated endonuclease/helicase Cas3
LNDTLSDQRKDLNQIENILKYEIEIDEVQTILREVDLRTLRKGLRRIEINEKSIETYFLINYLFSLLIEADKLDATDVEVYFPKKIDASCVDHRFGNRVKFQKPIFEKLNIEKIRNFCRSEVVSHLDRQETFEYNIFTLTAPTGVGKTMTALDFALKLKQKLEEDNEKKIRIIYALPFVNIIEQALLEYKKTLPREVVVLGHYQYADIFGQESKEIKDEPISYNQLKMITDTWQADVVITSFVQFFETLIGNRNKLLKKFSHYSNSIIILDEVQALRLDHMPLVGASLFYLTKFLKSKIILMTATKPKILELAQSEILSERGEKIDSLELLTSFKEVFKFFTRTQIVPLIEFPINETNNFIDGIFEKKWSKKKSCLIVVNTVSRSLELFQCVKKYLDEKNLKNPLEYTLKPP